MFCFVLNIYSVNKSHIAMRTHPIMDILMKSIYSYISFEIIFLLLITASIFTVTTAHGKSILLQTNQDWMDEIIYDHENEWRTDQLEPAYLYSISISIQAAGLKYDDRYNVRLNDESGAIFNKVLHAGDPSAFLTFRPRSKSAVTLHWNPLYENSETLISAPAFVSIQKIEVHPNDQHLFESEPNDTWKQANTLILGRNTYGGSDDIEYLDHQNEYKEGWDWFQFDFNRNEPMLTFFDLELVDRDIPMQLLLYRYNSQTKKVEPYTRGKDPMEVLHDGQKRRYSKFISRVLTKGKYYLKVLGNHPFYLLRTTIYPVPPYEDSSQAVETAMHYMASIGDAWFAQIPRLGSRYKRSVMLHDEASRCTACHPAAFPLESNFSAYKNGYPIHAKSQVQYLMDRVYNAPTPLYGNPGVNWVRFVAIQLQYFGTQGSLIVDFENDITKVRTPYLKRFTGMLHAAWDHRNDLPADERNGVTPLDSKFGFAWRDWRVVDEYHRRTGDKRARFTADKIESIFTSKTSLSRIEENVKLF